MNEEPEIINNENWYDTFDGILWKLKQLRDENIALKKENETLKEVLNGYEEKNV